MEDKNSLIAEFHTWKCRNLHCCVVGFTLGHRCGYVEIPSDHPLYEKNIDDPLVLELEVQGGITHCEKGNSCMSEGWWVGFDCMHTGDGIDPEICNPVYLEMRQEQIRREKEFLDKYPKGILHEMLNNPKIWTHEMTVEETERLANQIADF